MRLEPYSVHRTKRLIKAAKLYWSDVGLGLHLAGGEPSGAHLENLVLGDLLAWRDIQIPRAEVLYWRTATNQEVDLVIESRQGLVGIEVKATRRPGPRSAQHLQAFRDEYAIGSWAVSCSTAAKRRSGSRMGSWRPRGGGSCRVACSLLGVIALTLAVNSSGNRRRALVLRASQRLSLGDP